MNKKKKSGILGAIFGFLLGGALGVFLVLCMEHYMHDELTTGQELAQLLIMLLSLYLALFLQIVIHEAGHLIFGLVSGYRFVSFRIAGFQWTRVGNQIRFGRHSLAGTAGQCLMSPPDLINGTMPFLLYNLGGSLTNLIIAGLFLIPLFFKNVSGVFSFFCLSMTLIGILFALSNGIPMRLASVDNDGYNALSLMKNKNAIRAFWLQLKINAGISSGKRLKEMPDEWFVFPNDDGMNNSMVAAIGVFCCNRLLDQNRYEEADALMEHMLTIESGMLGVHRSMLICDRMCCEMIGQNRREHIEQLYTGEQKTFMKSMKNSPSVIRTQYIYALLVEQDPVKETAILAKFENVAKTYPYPNDMQSDREMMDAAKRKAESGAQCNG